MDGITKEEFLANCEGLNNAIIEELKEDRSPNNHDVNLFASIIIDLSNGKIQSDDEQLVNLFNEVLDICSSIKRYTYKVSHYQAQMKKNLPPKELEQNALSYIINRKLLVKYYNKALIVTNKVKELGIIK